MNRLPACRLLLATIVSAFAPSASDLAAQASYRTYRTSCAGAVSVPTLSAGVPVAGSAWNLIVAGLAPNTAGTVLFGVRDDRQGPLSLPFELVAPGAPGCFLNVNGDPANGAIGFGLTSNGDGQSQVSVNLPSGPSLAGVVFFNQYVSLEAPLGRGASITTTNAGRGVIGMPVPLGVAGMIPIPAGTYQRGSNDGPNGVFGPAHQVTISQPFWMAEHEVTQAEFLALMGFNRSAFVGPTRPVEVITWREALEYCARLTQQERAAGNLPAGHEYRLPTDGEWEYACRAGTTTHYNVGSNLVCAQANGSLQQNAAGAWIPCRNETAPVGSYAPNAWGLCDMHGNVEEWCLDYFSSHPTGPVTDPYVISGSRRVARGGGWFGSPGTLWSARRWGAPPWTMDVDLGFRIVLAPVLVGH